MKSVPAESRLTIDLDEQQQTGSKHDSASEERHNVSPRSNRSLIDDVGQERRQAVVGMEQIQPENLDIEQEKHKFQEMTDD